MKKRNTTSCIVVLLILLSSCVTTKQFERDFNKASLEGREQGKEVFILTKSGEKYEGKVLTFSKWSQWKAKQKENWVAVDGKQVDRKDIEAIQNQYSYKAFFQRSDYEKGSTIPVNRIKFGKINLYYYTHEPLGLKADDVRGSYHVYVFEKEKGKLQELNFASFSNAINDNPAAIKKFNESFPKAVIPRFGEKKNLESLIAVLEIYNN